MNSSEQEENGLLIIFIIFNHTYFSKIQEVRNILAPVNALAKLTKIMQLFCIKNGVFFLIILLLKCE